MSGENSVVLLPDGIKLPNDVPFLVVWVGPLRSHPSPGHERDLIVEIVFQEIESEKSLAWDSVKNVVAKSPPRTEWLPLLFLVHARVGTIWKNKRNIGTIRFTVRSFDGVIGLTDWSFESGQTILKGLYDGWLPSMIDADMSWPASSTAFFRSNFVRLSRKSSDHSTEPSEILIPCTTIFHSIFYISDRLSQHILLGDFEGKNNRLYDDEKTTFDEATGKMHLVLHSDMLAQDEWAIAMLLTNPRGVPSMRIIRNSSLHHTFDKSFELRAHLPFAGEFQCKLRGIELRGVNSQTIFIGLDIISLKTDIFVKELTVPRDRKTNPQDPQNQPPPPPPPNIHEQAPAPNIPNSQELSPEFKESSLRDQHSARFKSKKYRSAYFAQGDVKKERIYQSKPHPKARNKPRSKKAHPKFSTNPRGNSDTGIPRADGSAQAQIAPEISDELNADGGIYAERLGMILKKLHRRGYHIAPSLTECYTTDPIRHLHFPVCGSVSQITSIKSSDGTQRPRRIFVYRISNPTRTAFAYIFDFERTHQWEISKWILIVRGEDVNSPFGDKEMKEFLLQYVQKNANLGELNNDSFRKVFDQEQIFDQEQTEELHQGQNNRRLSYAEAWCDRHLPNFIQALREKIPDPKVQPDSIISPSIANPPPALEAS